jgi:acyl dehydratase
VTAEPIVKVFNGLDELVAAEGAKLGPTEWLQIDQDRVDLFADATEDHQWIHVDPDCLAKSRSQVTRSAALLVRALP